MRIEGAHGPLGKAKSDAIVAGLKAQSPQGSVLDHHLAIEEALTDNALTAGNRVTLLEDGKATYASMLAALRGAKSSIGMEAYIFEDDEIGAEFASALEERAKAGVKVRLIYDSVGSNKTPKEFFKAMSAAGVQVVEFNPLSPETVVKSGLAALNHRDHRKLTVIDGRVAFLGGINISGVYMSGSAGSGPSAGGSNGASSQARAGKDYDPKDPPFDKRPWRDTQVRIEGPAVADLERAFLRQWAAQKKENLLDDKGYFPKLAAVGTQYVRVIESSPASSGTGLNPLYLTVISAIDHAETEVRITMAYFVPHPELMRALKEAAGRGVDVKLILPSRTDSWIVFQAGRSYYGDLLEAGVKIYERKTRLLHAKTATIDGVWSTVGSTNLDWRSLVDNDELNAVVLGPDLATQMNAVFDKDLANSSAITRDEWARRSIVDRVKEAAAKAWSRLL
ncbi:MAG TPA: phospholipase D-like domain-containing protein [Usitatibacter sp.]|nr:phospholipase D-like domain-containing protein [Usitatibacter sp.]